MDTQEKIKQQVTGNPVVLYMKGTPQFPQCGFSALAVQALNACGVQNFYSVNVLENPDIRQGIKEYANWPTIPQLYVKGEFVGGSDIVREMYESGELHETLGVKVEPVAAPTVRVTTAAANALGEALADAASQEPGGEHHIRIEIDEDYQHALSISAKQARDIEVPIGKLTLLFDRASARRAQGLG